MNQTLLYSMYWSDNTSNVWQHIALDIALHQEHLAATE